MICAWMMEKRRNVFLGLNYKIVESDERKRKGKVILRLILCVRKWRCFIMLRPTAVQVEAICEYQILVEFDNGEKMF